MNTPTDRKIHVRDLPPWEPSTRIDTPDGPAWLVPHHPMLFCRECGAEYSANPGDYWNTPKDHVFKCCGEPMRLVYKRTRYEEVEA